MEAAGGPAGLENLRLVGSGPQMLHPKLLGLLHCFHSLGQVGASFGDAGCRVVRMWGCRHRTAAPRGACASAPSSDLIPPHKC